jgi:uncharacterized protein
MNIGIICTALLGLLLFGLGLHVSIQRGRHQRLIGHDASPDDPVYRAVRAHANSAEYVPFFAILFLWFATRQASTWIEAVIVIATVARYLIAAGLLWGKSLNKPNPARFAGAFLTYACGFALIVGLIRT